MNIHEYQAKALLERYGVPVPKGDVAYTAADARRIAGELSGNFWVVKAQVHAGNRGQSGGARLCRSRNEVETAAHKMLGMRLVTRQTGPEGKLVQKVLVEKGADVRQELYLAVALDRDAGCFTVLASPRGGMDIEEVDRKDICAVPLVGRHVWPWQGRKLFFFCGLEPALVAKGAQLVQELVRFCSDKDATMLEINPLAVTGDGGLMALDAKIVFDDSALKRHPEIAILADPEEMDPLERKAAELGVNYVRLDGHIGTMVNGAGLAMATIDAITRAGGRPANFLDAGGGATVDMVRKGFEVMLADPKVRGVFVNIFGGILRCDVVAEGVVQAARSLNLTLPVVIRMEGTNVAEGRRVLDECGMNFTTASSMEEAVRLIVEQTGGPAG